jgi:lantibiotic modifying enzyme
MSVTGGPGPGTAAVRPAHALADRVVREAADSLLARHRAMPQGGWAWRSAIQAPHFQTDRDVGAAGIGQGLLAAYAATGDVRYLNAAEAAGDFLLAVAEPAEGGLRWPDWADANGRRSETHFTSFDDGAAGISDYLWTLSTVSGEERFQTGALEGMRWLMAQARGRECPAVACSWRWTDDPTWHRAYYGVGMGDAGIVLTFDAFADRTGDPVYRDYARTGAAQLRTLTGDGTRPPPSGSDDPSHDTGFLSGSAGVASMFLERYARDGNPADLDAARGLLQWVRDRAVPGASRGLHWPVSDRDPSAASGFELGTAGVAWVFLEAASATGDAGYLDTARRAGVWLRRSRTANDDWRETPGDRGSPIHIGLDSGGAGIGWVLDALAAAGLDAGANEKVAHAALAEIDALAVHERTGDFWYEHRPDGLKAEPSWHWGAAGLAAFAARMAGWSAAGPGGQAIP